MTVPYDSLKKVGISWSFSKLYEKKKLRSIATIENKWPVFQVWEKVLIPLLFLFCHVNINQCSSRLMLFSFLKVKSFCSAPRIESSGWSRHREICAPQKFEKKTFTISSPELSILAERIGGTRMDFFFQEKLKQTNSRPTVGLGGGGGLFLYNYPSWMP